MKKIIKTQDCVFVIRYNVSTRRTQCFTYTKECPMFVKVCVFYTEEPLDMFFQSDKDLLSDIQYYTSSSISRIVKLKRPVFFGKDGRCLLSYWRL